MGHLASPIGGIFAKGCSNRRLQVGHSRCLSHQLDCFRRKGHELAILSSLLLFHTGHDTWNKELEFVNISQSIWHVTFDMSRRFTNINLNLISQI